MFLILSISGQNPVYEVRFKAIQVEAHILAVSTEIRSVHGEDEDIFLAEISSKGAHTELVKLVDRYKGQPIRRVLLRDRASFRMHITRTPSCDAPAQGFFLGAERNIFDQRTGGRLKEAGSEDLPCYLIEHDATKILK